MGANCLKLRGRFYFAQRGHFYFAATSGSVARSTLADANESHDWLIYGDFAQVLISMARPLYATDPIGVDLVESLYALTLIQDNSQEELSESGAAMRRH
jgi:hypothetical protein